MRRRPSLLLAILAGLPVDGAGAAEEIRIEFATPLTGPFVIAGARHRAAVELAFRDLNECARYSQTPARLVSTDDPYRIGEAEAAAGRCQCRVRHRLDS
jgi:ABC-type branched-subunit amino acid transport system substrate-binding protein